MQDSDTTAAVSIFSSVGFIMGRIGLLAEGTGFITYKECFVTILKVLQIKPKTLSMSLTYSFGHT